MNRSRCRVLLVFAPLLLPVVLPVALPAQSAWQQIATASAPSPRHGAAMAHDHVRDRIVLWGGAGVSQLADTWEWDGASWTQRVLSQNPPSRAGRMCYDRGRARVVLVLQASSTPGPVTWEYDGTTWTPRPMAVQPTFPEASSVVYDSSRGVVVLATQGTVGTETWEYDGTSWTQLFPPASPPPRSGAGLVFDPLRNRTILHGGYDPNYFVLNDTWEYDGVAWVHSGSGPACDTFAITFDCHRRRAVSFGEYFATSQETHEYTAGVWFVATSSGPPPMRDATLVYDFTRQECVLFGGQLQGGAISGSTWRYRSWQPATVAPFGQGCTGTSIVPGFLPQPYHVPYLGMTFGVRMYAAPYNQPSFVAFGFSNTNAGSVPLPLSLQFLGMTSCTLYTSADILLPTSVSGANATTSFSVPVLPWLIGAHFFLQGFALDPGGNPANLIGTQALACTIGVP
jgi:hypothetical protein